jgi:hypothetical protein
MREMLAGGRRALRPLYMVALAQLQSNPITRTFAASEGCGRPFRVVVIAVMKAGAAARESSATFGLRATNVRRQSPGALTPSRVWPDGSRPTIFALDFHDLDADTSEADVVNVGLDEPPPEMQQAFDDSVQEPEKYPLGWQLVQGALPVKGVRAFQ